MLLEFPQKFIDDLERFRELKRVHPKCKLLVSSDFNQENILKRFIKSGNYGACSFLCEFILEQPNKPLYRKEIMKALDKILNIYS